jgi:LDH2 family malate/lactate/ureidoglycolate dehydrogenase
MTSPRFPADDLLSLASHLLERSGVRADDASLIARTLLAADRAGIYSHGLLRLPLYLEAVSAGGIDPTSRPSVVRRVGGTAVLDGEGAFGQVVMQRAVDLATEAAREHGIAAVAVQGSTHFGAGRFWTDQLAERGLAAVLTSSTGPVAAPFGGSRAILGTNPLTLSLPSSGPRPLVADLATTAGAYGKVVSARNEGTLVPEGWGVDAEARPTTDPSAVLDGGALLPFGGHKGSGISVLLEGLATALTSASLAARTVDIWQDRSSRMNTGHLLIALDLAAFGDPGQIRDRVAELQDEVRSSHPTGAVVAPGDLEHDRAAAGDGVELAASTAEQLRALARTHDLPFPAPLTEGTSR